MNQGLSHRFSINSKGSFTFTSGATKAKDNIYFLMLFDNNSRIYKDDYTPRLLFLVQKPSSYINLYKNLILGRLRKIVLKYVPLIDVTAVNLFYVRLGEKKVEVVLDYKFTGSTDNVPVEDKAVKFI